jgi:hypothetical protein
MRDRQILAGAPSIEIDVQHVLVEGGGVAADADQQTAPGWLCDDRMQRAGAPLVAMVERRGGGTIERREHGLGAEGLRRPGLEGGNRRCEWAGRRFNGRRSGD